MKLRAAKMTFISHHLHWPEPLSPVQLPATSYLVCLLLLFLASYHLLSIPQPEYFFQSMSQSMVFYYSILRQDNRRIYLVGWCGRLKMATHCLIFCHQEMGSVLLSFEYRGRFCDFFEQQNSVEVTLYQFAGLALRKREFLHPIS